MPPLQGMHPLHLHVFLPAGSSSMSHAASGASSLDCARRTPAETLPLAPLQGVRSLQLHGHLLSAGSSMSALSFLDLRMRAWLAVDGPQPRPIQTQVDDYSVSRADEAITALQASLPGRVQFPV